MRNVCGALLVDGKGTCMQLTRPGQRCAAHREPSQRPMLRRVEALERMREEVRRLNHNAQRLLRAVEKMRA